MELYSRFSLIFMNFREFSQFAIFVRTRALMENRDDSGKVVKIRKGNSENS